MAITIRRSQNVARGAASVASLATAGAPLHDLRVATAARAVLCGSPPTREYANGPSDIRMKTLNRRKISPYTGLDLKTFIACKKKEERYPDIFEDPLKMEWRLHQAGLYSFVHCMPKELLIAMLIAKHLYMTHEARQIEFQQSKEKWQPFNPERALEIYKELFKIYEHVYPVRHVNRDLRRMCPDQRRKEIMTRLSGGESDQDVEHRSNVISFSPSVLGNTINLAESPWWYLIQNTTCRGGIMRIAHSNVIGPPAIELGLMQEEISQIFRIFENIVSRLKKDPFGVILLLGMPPHTAQKLAYVAKPFGAAAEHNLHLLLRQPHLYMTRSHLQDGHQIRAVNTQNLLMRNLYSRGIVLLPALQNTSQSLSVQFPGEPGPISKDITQWHPSFGQSTPSGKRLVETRADAVSRTNIFMDQIASAYLRRFRAPLAIGSSVKTLPTFPKELE